MLIIEYIIPLNDEILYGSEIVILMIYNLKNNDLFYKLILSMIIRIVVHEILGG